MRAGTLRRKIVIQQAPKPWPTDAAGQPIPDATWDTFCSPWARRFFDKPGTEQLQAQQIVALSVPVFEVRADSKTRQVTADEQFRIVDQGRTYDITSAEPSERGDQITFRVKGRAEVAA